MDELHMSLDEIIKRESKTKRGGGNANVGKRFVRSDGGFPNSARRNRGNLSRPGRQQRYTVYGRSNINSTWKHDLYEGGPKERGSYLDSGYTKLLISNLEFGVSDHDLEELFSEFGTLVSASVRYDRSGRSLGTGELIFKSRNSAIAAMTYYNGVPLDGRPMHIQLVREREREPRENYKPRETFKPRGGGRGFGRGRDFQRRPRKETVTAEQLDAELDSYINSQ